VQRALAALRVVHPFPSLFNAALVAALALVALSRAGDVTGGLTVVALLALGMLGIQFAIGALNDFVDAPFDAVSKPAKPIPRGLVAPRTAGAVAVLAGGVGLLAAAALGPTVLLMALAMLAAGLVYDMWLKPTPWAWLCFSVAFPILPVYAWFGASGDLPPNWQVLLPVAALAGPALQLSNGLVDLEADRLARVATLPASLGRARAVALMAGLVAVIYILAWGTLGAGLSAPAPRPASLAVSGATALALLGVILSASRGSRRREAGWQAQCLAIGLLGVGWLLAA
jgi:4-hydroxybenzoate polyprenyltransferase